MATTTCPWSRACGFCIDQCLNCDRVFLASPLQTDNMAQVDERQTSGNLFLAPKNPPTASDWTAYRPFISHLYSKRQYTAGMVLKQLQVHGFVATLVDVPVNTYRVLSPIREKMLRDRLRHWRLYKNKRRSHRCPTNYMTIPSSVHSQVTS